MPHFRADATPPCCHLIAYFMRRHYWLFAAIVRLIGADFSSFSLFFCRRQAAAFFRADYAAAMALAFTLRR
jgi:hypothetical protein